MTAAKAKTKSTNLDRNIGTLTTTAQEINPGSVADLRPSGYNPRTITASQQTMLNDSLHEFGDIGVIIFNRRTGRLVGGHQRTKLLDPTWPIVKQDHADGLGTVAKGYIDTPFGHLTYREVDWDEQKEKLANVAANKHGGSFDEELLSQLLIELEAQGANLELTGFDTSELDELLGRESEKKLGKEDPEVLPVEDPFVKLGDLWVLGESRLLVGDSTSIVDLDKLLMGEKADLVVTDPPYNVGYEGNAGKIENDSMSDAAFDKFLADVFSVLHHGLKPGGAFYIYHAEGRNLGHAFSGAIVNTKGLLLKQQLVWVKDCSLLGRQDYNWRHEPVLYGWKEGAAHYYDGDFTSTTVIDDDIDISKMDKKQLQTLVAEMRNREPSSVVRIDKPVKSDIHPTMKPVRLFERNVHASSRMGEIALDLFNGSGTLIIACRKTGRRGRGMELDPRYAQATLKRYWDYCEEEPQLLLSEGQTIPYSEVEKQRAQK